MVASLLTHLLSSHVFSCEPSPINAAYLRTLKNDFSIRLISPALLALLAPMTVLLFDQNGDSCAMLRKRVEHSMTPVRMNLHHILIADHDSPGLPTRADSEPPSSPPSPVTEHFRDPRVSQAQIVRNPG